MLKLATHIPNLSDSTSFYRAMGPLNELRRAMPELNMHHLAKYNWATIDECDAIFLQRPSSKDEVGIMQMAKDVGVPIWVDYDDLLVAVPTDNPAYFTYMKEDRHANIKWIVENADHLTVSTESLKLGLQQWNKNITVVPNAINMRHFPYRKPANRTKRIVWRGSKTHQRDVFTYAQTLFALHAKHKSWAWHFIGDNMWFITDNMEHHRTVVHEPIEWPAYFRLLQDLAPSIMLVPLHEHPFNYAKSNIAWIEGCFAGAVTVAPNWGEWQKPGVFNFDTEPQLLAALESIIEGDRGQVNHLANHGWEYVMDNLQLQKVNLLRENVLRSLCEKR